MPSSHPSQERRVAAIVAIDLVGYTALVESDAELAFASVTRVRELAESVAESHDGRIFSTAGDAVMLEFPTASEALAATIVLWETERDVVLRYGVHVGEVVPAPDGDLLGHGVNVAARLQTQASPGGILASRDVFESAKPELAQRLKARGRIRLAKMRETIAVFALDRADQPMRQSGTPVLAVLAFDPSPNNESMRLLADGVSEEILFAVSRAPGLKVIGATSSFVFRGDEKAKAGEMLGATHVLDGSVRRVDDRVRVAARLQEVDSGVVLWSERFDRHFEDALELQDAIAGEVAKALATALRQGKTPKVSAALLNAYFEAREHLRSGSTSRVAIAAEQLERIVRQAPDFARAWAGLAIAKLEVLRLARTDRLRLVDDAREAAERALGLDQTLGEAYTVLAALEGEYFSRWREREALLTKALEAEPNNPLLLFRHGQFLVATGRVEAGYAQQARAYELDPLDATFAAFHGYNLWSTTSKDEGRKILDDAAARSPDNVFVWFMRLNTAALSGDFAMAERLREEGAKLVPGLVETAPYKAGLRMQEVMAAPSPEAFIKLGEDFETIAEEQPSAALDLAVALSVLGFTQPALSIFEEALDNVDAWRAGALETTRPHLGYETALLFVDQTRALRMDPGFVNLCVRLGLVRYWRDTGHWPDCVAETAPVYDFKRACGAGRS